MNVAASWRQAALQQDSSHDGSDARAAETQPAVSRASRYRVSFRPVYGPTAMATDGEWMDSTSRHNSASVIGSCQCSAHRPALAPKSGIACWATVSLRDEGRSVRQSDPMTTSHEQFLGQTELIPRKLVRTGRVHHPAVLAEAKRRNKDFSCASPTRSRHSGVDELIWIHAALFAVSDNVLGRTRSPTLTLTCPSKRSSCRPSS